MLEGKVKCLKLSNWRNKRIETVKEWRILLSTCDDEIDCKVKLATCKYMYLNNRRNWNLDVFQKKNVDQFIIGNEKEEKVFFLGHVPWIHGQNRRSFD